MEHIAFVLEIVALFMCLHKANNKKIHPNMALFVSIMLMLTWIELINFFRLNAVFSVLNYVILFLYAKFIFGETIKVTLIRELVTICLIAGMQYIFLLITVFLRVGEQPVRMLICNAMVFAVCLLFSFVDSFQLYKVDRIENEKYLRNIIFFLLWIFVIILFQNKLLLGIRVDTFFFVAPAVVWIIYLVIKWIKEKGTVEQKEYELLQNRMAQKNYDELLERIRLNQHEFKNHITALLSAHYIYKSYENLVKAQSEHYEFLKHENRYNDLLLVGDDIIAGFLYGKVKEAEADKIEVVLELHTKIENLEINKYKVIEIVGILFDNAVEALKGSGDRTICLDIGTYGDYYVLKLRNPCEYIDCEEIESWFRMGKSQKGSNRGIGLYHVKKICEEEKCWIGCKNAWLEEKNWIEFILEIK